MPPSRVGPVRLGSRGTVDFRLLRPRAVVFRTGGVAMPRVSQEQFFTGPHVPYEDARPGDLLFWHYDPTDPTDIDHVAIYVGNGMMSSRLTPASRQTCRSRCRTSRVWCGSTRRSAPSSPSPSEVWEGVTGYH